MAHEPDFDLWDKILESFQGPGTWQDSLPGILCGLYKQGQDTQTQLNATPSSTIWPFQTNEAVQYAGGFYEFSGTDDNFSPAINFGVVNTSVAAHFLVVTGAVTTDQVTIRVSGTSITDDGVQTSSDSQDIVIPEGTPADSYFETPKKWNGQVAIETIAGTAVTCNYGWAKYYDFNNTNFTVVGLEAVWESDSTDSSSDIQLIHHKATGWTFNSGADPTPPTPIAARSTDHPGEDTHRVGSGAWKRSNLSQPVVGADSEGIMFCIASGSTGLGSLSFRLMSLQLLVVPTVT
jgi:hypothetical protein